MKILIIPITTFLLYAPTVLAHEAEELEEFTNLAEADWLGPLTALLIIIAAVGIAKILRKRKVEQT